MAGDITASAPVICADADAVEVAVEALNLAATTDVIHIVYLGNGQNAVFKAERGA